MTDRQAIMGFVITGLLLVLLIMVTLSLEVSNRSILLREHGIVELASVFGYFWCALFILYKGGFAYLLRYNYFFMLVIFFMLRELDFDKKFTTTGILKTRFFLSDDVHFLEKIIGALVVFILIYIVLRILFHHLKTFYYGLMSRSIISIGALLVFMLLVISKLLDGIGRKLNRVGVEIGEMASSHLSAVEEILELGIPIALLLTFSVYFKRIKVLP